MVNKSENPASQRLITINKYCSRGPLVNVPWPPVEIPDLNRRRYSGKREKNGQMSALIKTEISKCLATALFFDLLYKN